MSAPIVYITPNSGLSVPGVPIVLTAQGSTPVAGTSLTFTWSLTGPVGSLATLLYLAEATDVRLLPDVIGVYFITVIATDDLGFSASAESSIRIETFIQASNREKADVSYLDTGLSSFWQFLQNKETIRSLWGEYSKLLSGDIKRLATNMLSKSLSTIPEAYSVSNIIISPEVSLSEEKDATFIFSEGFYGNNGATTDSHITYAAVAFSTKDVTVVNATINAKRGTEVIVTIGSYTGTHKILTCKDNRLTLDTNLPTSSLLDTRSDFAHRAGTDQVFTAGANNIVIGNIIDIEGSRLTVLDSHVTNPALLPNHVVVSAQFSVTKTRINGKVYGTLRVQLNKIQSGLVDTLVVPAETVGGPGYFITGTEQRSVTILTPTQVKIVNNIPYTPGTVVRIVNLQNDSYTTIVRKSTENVYVVFPPIVVNKNENATANALITRPALYKDLLITIGNTTHKIASVDYNKNADGDEYASIKITKAGLLPNQVNLRWKIANVMSISTNLAPVGVNYGDVLRIELSVATKTFRSYIDCIVLGVWDKKIHFDITSTDILDGNFFTDNAVSFSDAVRILGQLHYPGVTVVNNQYVLSDIAEQVYNSIPTSKKINQYRIIKATTAVNNPSDDDCLFVTTSENKQDTVAKLYITPTYILRNTYIHIPYVDRIASVPALTEFIYNKNTQESANGTFIMQHTDGSILERADRERVLIENAHFTVQNAREIVFYTGSKLQSSLVVTIEGATLLTRQVQPLDTISINDTDYIIKSIISQTEVEILATDTTYSLETIALLNATCIIKKAVSVQESFICMTLESASYNNRLPNVMFAPVCIVDNNLAIEANFGTLVGYSIKDYYKFGQPIVSYKSAVKGLAFVQTSGASVYNIEIAVSILLNLPITEAAAEILEINNAYILLREFDEETQITKGIREYQIPTVNLVKPFSAYRQNPYTNQSFRVGEYLPAFTALTGRAFVLDYVNNPQYFRNLPIEKYHTWRVLIDLNAVDSRDIDVLYRFVHKTKPAHTKPIIEAILLLEDEVHAEDTFNVEGILRLYDDTTTLELTHNIDSYNIKGKFLRTVDDGELSTRSILLGRDLIYNGSTFTSNRGGFYLEELTTTGEERLQFDTKLLPQYAPFTGDLAVRGAKAVLPEDLLFIHTGVNTGVYTITAVVNNTTLEAVPLSGRLPTHTTPVLATEPALFSIMRKVSPIIATSLLCEAVSGNLASFSNANLNWDNVTTGDFLVKSSDFLDKTLILNVVYDPTIELYAVTLETEAALIEGESYFIYRDALIPKDYGNGSVTNLIDNRIYHDFVDIYQIDDGDYIEIVSGVDAGLQYKIIHVMGDSVILNEVGNISINDTIKFLKRSRPLLDNSDKRLEFLQNYDSVNVVLESASPIAVPTPAGTFCGLSVTEFSNINGGVGDLISLIELGNVIYYGKILKVVGAVITSADLYSSPVLSTGPYIVKISKQSKS